MMFFVTPEPIAVEMAASAATGGLHLDPFCGAGGNAIALVRRDEKDERIPSFVLCVDTQRSRLDDTLFNARLYPRKPNFEQKEKDRPAPSAASWMDCIHGDSQRIKFRTDVFDSVLLSPPWGGRIDSAAQSKFSLTSLAPGLVSKSARPISEGSQSMIEARARSVCRYPSIRLCEEELWAPTKRNLVKRDVKK
eukprot:Selendium_serpulae@DN4953_c0_g1_i2.p2